MKSLLSQISDTALKLRYIEFAKSQVNNQWLGNEPSIESGISEVEKKLNVQFASDYKEFLLISNVFSPNQKHLFNRKHWWTKKSKAHLMDSSHNWFFLSHLT